MLLMRVTPTDIRNWFAHGCYCTKPWRESAVIVLAITLSKIVSMQALQDLRDHAKVLLSWFPFRTRSYKGLPFFLISFSVAVGFFFE